MTGVIKWTKWHTVNAGTAQSLTTITNSPGVIYGMAITELPDKLKLIPGVASYYVIGYASRQALNDGLTVGGELLVTRVESGSQRTTSLGLPPRQVVPPTSLAHTRDFVGTMWTVGKAFP